MKYSKHDETIDRAVLEMREMSAPGSATERAVEVVAKPVVRHGTRRLSMAVRLAGVAGTAAALALAFWPRTGEGLAWAQVASQYEKEPRLHEVIEIQASDGSWKRFMDRWQDGQKYSLWFGTTQKFMIEIRFDGKRYYSYRAPLKMSTVKTVNEAERSSILWLGKIGERNETLDTFLKRGNLKVKSQKEQTDPELGSVVRYRISGNGKVRKGFLVEQTYDVDVDPVSGKIRRWQTYDQKGGLVQRGILDFPETIADTQFQPPTNPPKPLFDIDQARPGVVEHMKKGLATVGKGANRAVIREILVEEDRFVWVFWTGTPPNGRLDHPIKVIGAKQEKAWGMPNFTTSRVALTKRFEPSTVFTQPLGGMCVVLTKPAPNRLTMQIPLFEPARTKPVKDARGNVLGYESKFVGYQTVRDLPVTRVSAIWDFAAELGIQQKPLTAPKGKVGITGPVYRVNHSR